MKMTKARQAYTCNNCKATISKGDLYRKKTVSVGQPWKDEGNPYLLLEISRIAYQVCTCCCPKPEVAA